MNLGEGMYLEWHEGVRAIESKYSSVVMRVGLKQLSSAELELVDEPDENLLV
jgi:hypothetical protein